MKMKRSLKMQIKYIGRIDKLLEILKTYKGKTLKDLRGN